MVWFLERPGPITKAVVHCCWFAVLKTRPNFVHWLRPWASPSSKPFFRPDTLTLEPTSARAVWKTLLTSGAVRFPAILEGVDLAIVHINATPRQLVGVSQALGVEVWDRVRLLLALFTAHASSVEARTQVRIAQLQSDRTILRELAQQQTTGERAGYGGGVSLHCKASLPTSIEN